MKNQFKKVDSKGNKLKEAIGKGVDHAHYKKIKEARAKSEMIIFKCTKEQKSNFKEKVSKMDGINESDVLRFLMNEFLKSK